SGLADGQAFQVYYDPLPPVADQYSLLGSVYGWTTDDSYGYAGSFGTRPTAKIFAVTKVNFDTLVCRASHDTIVRIKNECRGVLTVSAVQIVGSTDFSVISTSRTLPALLAQ